MLILEKGVQAKQGYFVWNRENVCWKEGMLEEPAADKRDLSRAIRMAMAWARTWIWQNVFLSVPSFADKARLESLSLTARSSKLDGVAVFSGNLFDKVYVKLRRGSLDKPGRVVIKESFIPIHHRNPYRLRGSFPKLQFGGMYTFSISSSRAGVLARRSFSLKRK